MGFVKGKFSGGWCLGCRYGVRFGVFGVLWGFMGGEGVFVMVLCIVVVIRFLIGCLGS